MSAELMRSYLDLLNEQQQQQLDEGVMDAIAAKIKPWIQKNIGSFFSKLDPQTLQGLKQAHQQSGGDIKRFASIIGITPQDVAPLAKKAPQNALKETFGEKIPDTANNWMLGTGTSLKSKILTGLFNWAPLVTLLDLLTGANLATALGAGPNQPLTYLWYIICGVLFWGIGSYDFGDMDKAPKDRPRIH